MYLNSTTRIEGALHMSDRGYDDLKTKQEGNKESKWQTQPKKAADNITMLLSSSVKNLEIFC